MRNAVAITATLTRAEVLGGHPFVGVTLELNGHAVSLHGDGVILGHVVHVARGAQHVVHTELMVGVRHTAQTHCHQRDHADFA